MRNRFWSLLHDKRTGRRVRAAHILAGLKRNPHSRISPWTILFILVLFMVVGGLVGLVWLG